MSITKKSHTLKRVKKEPELSSNFDDWGGKDTPSVCIDSFHKQSSSHRPVTKVKTVYDEKKIYLRFQVYDNYIRAVHTEFQSYVANDSCIEFFIQPNPEKGYFNFEINCIGTLLVYYIEPESGQENRFQNYVPLTINDVKGIKIYPTFQDPISEEIHVPTTWEVIFTIPFRLLDAYCQCGTPVKGTKWFGNFYKCGDETSRPHWASWNKIGDALDFHQPEYFGLLLFE